MMTSAAALQNLLDQIVVAVETHPGISVAELHHGIRLSFPSATADHCKYLTNHLLELGRLRIVYDYFLYVSSTS